jgi:chromate transport protein ChrA
MYHAGLVCAIFAFILWCLPGAIGMFLLSVGVGKIGETLPGPVYGLLSGLNASTVGIIALAAVQVSPLLHRPFSFCPSLSVLLLLVLSFTCS